MLQLTFCGGTVLAGIGGMFSESSGLVEEVPSEPVAWFDAAAAAAAASALEMKSSNHYPLSNRIIRKLSYAQKGMLVTYPN